MKSQYPSVSQEWDYKKNSPHVPEEFPYGSNKKAWWKCITCGHEWQAIIATRTVRGYGCPECRKSHRKVKSKDNKKVITMDDLEGFSDELKEQVKLMQERGNA